MTMQRLRATGMRGRRHLVALLCVWLALLVQPCAMALPAAAASMEHCHSAVQTDPPAPCPAMLAGHCRMSVDAHVDSPKAGHEVAVPTPAVLLALIEPVDSATCLSPPEPGIRAGPPLHIRFCNLRN